MMMGEEVTSDWIEKEVATAEAKLEKNERKRQRQQEDQVVADASPFQRLLELENEVDCLELSREVAMWYSEPSCLTEEAQHCIGLAQLLCRYEVTSTAAQRLYDSLWTKEYQPLHRYVRGKLITSLRRSLGEAGYPSEEGCSKLMTDCQHFDAKDSSFASYCYWLARLQQAHKQLDARIGGGIEDAHPTDRSDVIVELCRPIVERLQYHFVEKSENRITSTRLERLPEWVLGYIREHALEGGPWDLISDELATIVDDAPFQFLTEMVQLAQHVLVQRNFFRSDLVAGPRSKPMLLSNGIEQLLLFDADIRELCPEQRYPIGLSQSLIASDADLWKWWLDRERESTLSALFDTQVTERPPDRISPRAEIFCALIRSIQLKTALFETPGPYLSHVAVPLCMNFLDAVHSTATDLRNLLSQRKMPSNMDMKSNVEEWIELINGTHLASIHLQRGDTRQFGLVLSIGVGSDNDLARVGRSFERLRDGLVDDYATTLIETVIMERARLASYLMRCSHLLASTDVQVDPIGFSPDLQDSRAVFSLVLRQCTPKTSDPTNDGMDQYAPAAIRSNVVDRFADKFLEVLLDAHGMTPDLVLEGCRVVSEDVRTLFHGLDSPLALRLLSVTSFMTMDSRQMHALRTALFGLAEASRLPEELPLLNFAQFSSDGTLLEEAISMLRAKGHGLHLEDAISILNRRKDSFF